MLPQFTLLKRFRDFHNVYVVSSSCLRGYYRTLYILNWIERAHTEVLYRPNYVVYFGATVQTLIFAEFCYSIVRREIERTEWINAETEILDVNPVILESPDPEPNESTVDTVVEEESDSSHVHKESDLTTPLLHSDGTSA